MKINHLDLDVDENLYLLNKTKQKKNEENLMKFAFIKKEKKTI